MTQQNIPETIPAGYMKNALGHLVPRANVREQDLLCDEIAKKVAGRAIRLNLELTEFKSETLGEVADLIKIAGERYDAVMGGKKGNVSISSYDGKYKIQRSVAERIQFTVEIEAAKTLINQCIARWSEGANDKIRAIVDRAFSKDRNGQLKTAAVLDLMRLDIDDAEWKRAMDAIRDSIQTTGTAIYVRVYERIGDSDQYKAIPLDLAAV